MKKLLFPGFLLTAMGIMCWPGSKLKSQTTDVVLIGAGDIADGLGFNLSGAFATAALLDANPTATVFALGDQSYGHSTDNDFARSYDPTWGRAKLRTIPVIGHHGYDSLNGLAYFNYFGPAAGHPSKGYYSLDLGAWHIVVLNSECSYVPGGCGVGSPQETWLVNDLASHTQACTLALFHETLYTSSSQVTPNTAVRPFWQDLYNYNAELIVNGHAHNYERFARQDANGNLDTARGIVEIVAGTGGDSHYAFNSTIASNSLVRNSDTYGVLELTLHQSSFDWKFIPVAGKTFTDSGTQACH